jgi:hypothetical protein
MATQLESIELAVTLRARMQNALADDHVLAEIDDVGFKWSPATPVTSGTAANQADRILYKADEEITSGNDLVLNMHDGTSWDGQGTNLDLLGETLDMPEIVALFVENDPSSAGNLVIGGEGTANAWLGFLGANSHTITLKPGGVFFIFCPPNPAMAVGGADNQLLQFAASGGNVTFRAAALGRSA